MAITKIYAIKATVSKAILYIINPAKTDGQLLISGYNTQPQTAPIDFRTTDVLARKSRNAKHSLHSNLAYHLIQSFSPDDDLTPEEAHKIGYKLAQEFTQGKYEFFCS